MSKTKITKRSKNSTAIAGEFAVLSQLALREYDANLTLGNTKGVDILVSKPSGDMYRLEVKTSFSKPSHSKDFGYCLGWRMDKKHETIVDLKLFYCFVNIEQEGNAFRFFVVPSKIVADYVRDQHKFYLKKHPGNKDTDMRVFRIGLETSNYPIITPNAEKFENKWEFRS